MQVIRRSTFLPLFALALLAVAPAVRGQLVFTLTGTAGYFAFDLGHDNEMDFQITNLTISAIPAFDLRSALRVAGARRGGHAQAVPPAHGLRVRSHLWSPA